MLHGGRQAVGAHHLQKQLFVHKGKPMAGPLRAFVELAGEML